MKRETRDIRLVWSEVRQRESSGSTRDGIQKELSTRAKRTNGVYSKGISGRTWCDGHSRMRSCSEVK